MKIVLGLLFTTALLGLSSRSAGPAEQKYPELFQTSDRCIACHNGLKTPSGEDISIGSDWRGSMMANSARDPYWQAAVRREVLDHPARQAAIEEECATCHMPMARFEAKAAGRRQQVFASRADSNLEVRSRYLAEDGVSCTMCHQIKRTNLGDQAGFSGGFEVDVDTGPGNRDIFGPFAVDEGRARVMRSASDFRPSESSHIQSSELCSTCHTLYTHALGPEGEVVGRLPEQVPYLEWLHSYFRATKSCQSCHMPEVTSEVPISAVLGQPRPGVSRHGFRGGNFFVLRMLNKYRLDLSVRALPEELEVAAAETEHFLETETAQLYLARVDLNQAQLTVDVSVRNLAGHKLPTGYPSRRVWLRFTVRNAAGRLLFESGGLAGSGEIKGNDNDSDSALYEPSYSQITRPDQVQVYETIMVDLEGAVTTGLLTAVAFVKDNRLLPLGFDKATASADIAVRGRAFVDADFEAGGDTIRYVVDLPGEEGPLTVSAELYYQPISYRWAQNLRPYDSKETKRFVSYFDSMSASSAVVLGRSVVTVP